MDLKKQIVKVKKLQAIGTINPTYSLILPKRWLDTMNWDRKTKIVLEFLPHREMIIVSNEKISNIEQV